MLLFFGRIFPLRFKNCLIFAIPREKVSAPWPNKFFYLECFLALFKTLHGGKENISIVHSKSLKMRS